MAGWKGNGAIHGLYFRARDRCPLCRYTNQLLSPHLMCQTGKVMFSGRHKIAAQGAKT